MVFQFTDRSNSEDQIAQHVLKIRLEMGLTQEQFAIKLGVSFPTVNRWENKKTKPSPLAIQKLQKLLTTLQKNCK
jgi:DNA-binding transcriptional regulator YiaG